MMKRAMRENHTQGDDYSNGEFHVAIKKQIINT